MSLVFHVLAVFLLAWLIRPTPSGSGESPGRGVGIVLKNYQEQSDYFDGETEGEQATDTVTATSEPSEALATLPSKEQAAFDTSSVLPAQMPVIGAGALEQGSVGGAGEMTAGASQPRSATGGKAQVNIYDVQGEGQKFVFVFDRSESMTGAPLASAKAQLLSSLEGLESTHQFQVVFFNHEYRIFDLSGGQKRMPFATDRTKGLAARFIQGITASGGTRRYEALSAGLSMRPDVLFFLTDVSDIAGNLDTMTPGELDRIRRKNRGVTTIHTIHFGAGPLRRRNNFLMQLAAQNSGEYAYVDTSKLVR